MLEKTLTKAACLNVSKVRRFQFKSFLAFQNKSDAKLFWRNVKDVWIDQLQIEIADLSRTPNLGDNTQEKFNTNSNLDLDICNRAT